MPSGAESGLEHGPANLAGDEVDAGWEDMPESASVPVRRSALASAPPKPTTLRPLANASQSPPTSAGPPPALSLPPVLSAPRPRSSIRELASRRPTLSPGEGRDASAVSAASAPGGVDDSALEISVESDDHVNIEVSENEGEDLWETLRAEGESVEDERDEERFEARVGVEGAEVSAGAFSSSTEEALPDFRRRQPGRKTIAVLVASAAAVIVGGVAWGQHVRPDERLTASVAEAVLERPLQESAREPRAPSPTPLSTSEPAGALASAPEGAAEPPLVKTVTAVAATVKTVPLRKRAPKRRVETAPQSDSPYEEPSQDSKMATTPVATAEPAPESTPRAATQPGAAPGESPSE
jgi:hypothetical protein